MSTYHGQHPDVGHDVPIVLCVQPVRILGNDGKHALEDSNGNACKGKSRYISASYNTKQQTVEYSVFEVNIFYG